MLPLVPDAKTNLVIISCEKKVSVLKIVTQLQCNMLFFRTLFFQLFIEI